MKITAETVKCARCVNCINNSLRLKMDKPGASRFGCETCYADRIGNRAELLFWKAEALRAMANVVADRYNRSFMAKDMGLAEWAVRRLKAVDSLWRMADEIRDAKDLGAVEAIKERYDAEYFGKGKDEEQ